MPSSIDVGRPSFKRGTWQTLECEVTSGQTFKVGDWVYKDTAGTLAIAAASGADVGAVKIFGRALANAADILALPSGRQLCPVEVPGHDGQFVAAVFHSTGASAVLAQTDVDAAATTVTLPLRNVSGQWCINKENNGTNDCVVVMQRHPKYAWSEQYGWFWCQLMDANRHDNAA